MPLFSTSNCTPTPPSRRRETKPPLTLKQLAKHIGLWFFVLVGISLGAAALGILTAAPAYADPVLIRHADRVAAKHNVDPALLKTICYLENNDWKSRDGAHGEKGVCQIKPDTVKMFCRACYQTDARLIAALNDPRSNIELAAMYLHWLERRVGNHPLILAAAYNGGPNGVARYLVRFEAAAPKFATP